MDKREFLGVTFDSGSMAESVEYAMSLTRRVPAHYVVTPNAEILLHCRRDPGAMEAVRAASLTLPDGVGVKYAGRILGRPVRERVAGADFALEIAGKLAETGGTLFLLGAKPGVAELAAGKLCEQFPALVIAGTLDGFFEDDAPVVEAINAARPDTLFVCLGSPRQEKWMYAHAGELDARLMVGLGGTLDAFAGTVPRAPRWMQKCGLEWLYRLIREPKRIGRMVKLPLVLFYALGARIRGK